MALRPSLTYTNKALGCAGSIGILINLIQNHREGSSSNGVPMLRFQCSVEVGLQRMSGRSNPYYSEFHHHHRHSHFSIFSPMTLTPMQEAAGAAIRSQNNVLLLSPTGSGKTLAFILPVIEMIDTNSPRLQAVVVVPTRELALQVESVLKEQTREIRSMSLYGGRPAMEEHRRLREINPHIIFATPGRLLDHIGKENLNVLSTRILIVDEYDKCLELGFREEMDNITTALVHVPQVVLTSATLFEEKSEENALGTPSLLQKREFKTIDFLATVHDLQARLEICIVPSPEKDKLSTLARLLTYLQGQSAIVFVAHRESAERIAKYLKEERFAATVYHGGMEQEVRERALYRFRAGASTILVSTDLAARGLDIPAVRAIIHYHLPIDEATFTHRSGRTARWEDTGTAFLMVGPEENIPAFVESNEVLNVDDITPQPFRPEWAVLYIGRGKKDKLSKADVLGFLCKKGGLTSAQIGRIDLGAHTAYVAVKRDVVKRVLHQIAGEKIKGMKTLIEEMRR